MKKIILLFTLLLLSSLPIQATEYYMISDVGVSAKTIGSGQVEGFSLYSSTLFENPAGLNHINNRSVSLFDSKIIEDLRYTTFALSQKTKYGHFAFGYMQATASDIPETFLRDGDSFPAIASYFDFKKTIYKLGYANSFSKNLNYGFTLSHYTDQYYSIKGFGSNLDAGLLYTDIDASEYSLTIQNLIPNQSVEFNNGSKETLPLQLVASAKRPIFNGAFLLPQVKYTKNTPLFSLGVQYKPSIIPFLEVFGGYKQTLTATEKTHGAATLGLALTFYGVEFQYAYEKSDYELQDNINYFSLHLAF